MFYRKKQHLKIQKIHHKALKVVYNSNKNYDELFRDNNDFQFIKRYLRALICVVFKSLKNLNPDFMWSYFVFKKITYLPYKKRSFAEITCYKIVILRYKFSAIQSMSTLGQFAPIC